MTIIGALEAAFALLVIDTGRLTCAELTDSQAHTIKVTSADRRLQAAPRLNVTLLLTRTTTRLTGVGADAAATDSTLVTIFWEGAGVRLWASPIDTDSIPSAIKVIQAGVLTCAVFADSVSATGVVRFTDSRLDAEACCTAHETTRTIVRVLTAVDAPLLFVVADATCIAVDICLAAWPFSAAAILTTHPRSEAIEVVLTWVVTKAASTNTFAQAI